MPVFRIERTRDYTVMCNTHLRDGRLSLKAKGLLSMMLSLPDEWNYTTRGLASICKEGVDAIGRTLRELEATGYIDRRQLRGANGRITDTEYIIYERPQERPGTASPDKNAPDTENPYLDEADTETPGEINIDILNTEKSNTDISNTHSFSPPTPSTDADDDGQTDGTQRRFDIREQIEYPSLCREYRQEQVDELVELMLEVEMNRSKTIRLGRDAEYPIAYVRQRFSQIGREHIEKVLDGIKENTASVRNTKAYLLSALFNAVSTLDNHYTMRVNHDLYGGE